MLAVMDDTTAASNDAPFKNSQTKEEWTEAKAKIRPDFRNTAAWMWAAV